MALIDEYKQAIQDVLDGRAPEAPKPSELPWTEDKAATMWAAAAAELIAEANGGDALPDTPGSDGTYALQNTVESGTGTLSWASGGGGGVLNISETVADNVATLDKTWQEIYDAFSTGMAVNLVDENEGEGVVYVYRVVSVSNDGLGVLSVTVWTPGEEAFGQLYECDAANKNPARSLS